MSFLFLSFFVFLLQYWWPGRYCQWAWVSCSSATFCQKCNHCFLSIPQVFKSLQNLEENGNLTKDSLSLDIFNTKEMVNAIILPNFVLTDLVFEGSNFNLRIYGCVDTSLETNPMDKKRPFPSSTSPTHKINVIALIYTCFLILFTIVRSLT